MARGAWRRAQCEQHSAAAAEFGAELQRLQTMNAALEQDRDALRSQLSDQSEACAMIFLFGKRNARCSF
jgi:hypothetical protein